MLDDNGPVVRATPEARTTSILPSGSLDNAPEKEQDGCPLDQHPKENMNVANRKPEVALVVTSVNLGLEDPELPCIATEIRVQYDRGVAGTLEAFEARLAIGALLNDARERIASDPEFAQWVAEQNFPWGVPWSRRLMQASRLEPFLRQALAAQGEISDEDQRSGWDARQRPRLQDASDPDTALVFRTILDAGRQLAIEAGVLQGPAPKPEPLGDEDLRDRTAQLVLEALVTSLDILNFMAIPDSEWLSISPSQRSTASEFFKLVAGRMVAVHTLWK